MPTTEPALASFLSQGCISLYLPDSVWIGRCHPFIQRYMEGRCNYVGIRSQDSKIQGRITSKYGLSWHQQSFLPWEPALEALGARIPDVDRAFYIWIIPDIDLYWWDCWYEVEGKVRCGAVGVSAVSQYGRLVYSVECQE